MTESTDPRAFLDSLKRDELEPPIVLPGMLKPAEDSDDYVMFAQGTVCQNWVRIAVDSIQSIELLQQVPCDEHSHPLVLLRLKPATSDEGKMFAALMQAVARNRPRSARRRSADPYGPTLSPFDPVDRGPAPRADRRAKTVRRSRSGGEPRAADDFRWCNSIPEIDIDDHGVWCLDWCWESEGQASYLPCDVLRTLTTEPVFK
ncbi:hypothetical protein [Kribbella sp. NPDC051770]|uniref:hypothetical protein n=1 Tax=Kribbella sp. NPDC051770 TaxID=3155413 RepID=UPI00341AB17B